MYEEASSRQESPALSLDDSASRSSPPVATPPEDSDFVPEPAFTKGAIRVVKKHAPKSPRPTRQPQARPRPQTKGSKLVVFQSDYDHTMEKTACHVCRTRSKRVKMGCNRTGCVKKFCAPCMRTRHGHMPEYQEPNFTFYANGHFVCPFCRGNCQCSVCTDKRARKAAGESASMRKRSYSSVHSTAWEESDEAPLPPPKKRRPPPLVRKASILKAPILANEIVASPLDFWTGPCLAQEGDEIDMLSPSSCEEDKSHPLHSQRELVRALGVGRRPPASPKPASGSGSGSGILPHQQLNTEAFASHVFDDAMLLSSPVSSTFTEPDNLLSCDFMLHNMPSFSCAWSGASMTALNGGAPSYLEP